MARTAKKSEDKYEHARSNAAGWLSSIEEMNEAHESARDNETFSGDRSEETERAIHESILSVQVRSGWFNPGERVARETSQPEEYELLLTTGGPALRIIGHLDEHCQPRTAELQMQDWGVPWERYPAPEATLLKFASVFWYGE